MEFDRNYIKHCPGQCFKFEDKYMEKPMMPHMHGKYMNDWGYMPKPCSNYMDMCEHMQMPYMARGEHMMYNIHQNMEPIENMCGKTYNILIMYVHKSMHKIMTENMGVMPKGISKMKFKQELNDMLCEVMKNEDEIKKIVVVDRNETNEEENTDRAFCPFCNGLLKDTLGILFITELLRGGCTHCY